jgi:hypothetical protein
LAVEITLKGRMLLLLIRQVKNAFGLGEPEKVPVAVAAVIFV